MDENIKEIYSGKLNLKKDLNKSAIQELDSLIGVQAVKNGKRPGGKADR